MAQVISEYKVIASALNDVQKKVNQHIAEGWVPLGGIAGGSMIFYQALIKYAEV